MTIFSVDYTHYWEWFIDRRHICARDLPHLLSKPSFHKALEAVIQVLNRHRRAGGGHVGYFRAAARCTLSRILAGQKSEVISVPWHLHWTERLIVQLQRVWDRLAAESYLVPMNWVHPLTLPGVHTKRIDIPTWFRILVVADKHVGIGLWLYPIYNRGPMNGS